MIQLRLASKRIQVDFLLFAAITFWILMDPNGLAFWGICAAVIHETGHILGITGCKRKITLVRFSILGAEICQEHYAGFNAKQEIFISACGPFFNFIFFAIFYFFQGECTPFGWSNLALGFVNLLPIEPLDGGNILYLILCSFIPERVAIISIEILSFLFLLPLGILGFVILFRSTYNFSLLFFCIYSVIFLVLKNHKENQYAK